VLAVGRLSSEVERGTAVGFLGPNGAGKTTTLRMLLGLVRPDEGTATINGRAYPDLAEPLHQVGAVLEAYLPYTAATTLGGTALGRAAFGPANGASTTATPLPFAAATALLAALAVLLAVLAARTTVRRDVG
jgi:ABC-type cobalamin/Fe3+-siderophores transport system ATPase subunit